MAQHDFVIDNADGRSVRVDMQEALRALASMNSGTTEPDIMYPGMLWLDLSISPDGIMRQRNQANTAWLPVLLPPDFRFNTADLYFGARTAPARWVWNDKYDGSGVDRMTLREDGLLTLNPSAGGTPTAAGDIVNKAYVDAIGVPIGGIMPFAMNSAPPKWMACNGASLIRDDYDPLFQKIGTTYGAADSSHFSLPDLRGEFVRGYDSSGTIDPGHAFGAKQADLMESHTHSVSGNTGNNNVGHTHTFSDNSSSTNTGSANHQHNIDGLIYNPGTNYQWGFDNVQSGPASVNPVTGASGAAHTHTVAVSGTTNTQSANHIHAVTLTAAAQAGGGGENRPRNIALLYCIKYL